MAPMAFTSKASIPGRGLSPALRPGAGRVVCLALATGRARLHSSPFVDRSNAHEPHADRQFTLQRAFKALGIEGESLM